MIYYHSKEGCLKKGEKRPNNYLLLDANKIKNKKPYTTSLKLTLKDITNIKWSSITRKLLPVGLYQYVTILR